MEAGKTTDLSGLSVLYFYLQPYSQDYSLPIISPALCQLRIENLGLAGRISLLLSFPPVLERDSECPPVLLILRTQQGITTLPESSKRPQDGDVTSQT